MMHALIKLQIVVVLKFVGNAEIGGEKNWGRESNEGIEQVAFTF